MSTPRAHGPALSRCPQGVRRAAASRCAGGTVLGVAGSERTEAALVRERLDAVLGRPRPLGEEDPDPDDLDPDDLRGEEPGSEEVAGEDRSDRGGRGGRGRHGARRAPGRPPEDPDLAEGLGLWPSLREALAERVPVSVRRARWAVPLPAVTAALLVAAVVVVALAVRSSATAPGVPVPVRSTAAAASAPVPAPTGPAATAGAPVATAAPGAPGPASAAPVPTSTAGAPAPGVGGAPVPASPSPPAELVVHVVGRVAAPGVVRLPVGARVVDALDAAGGATAEADLAQVNLARPVVDGEQVLVPAPGEEVLPAPAAPLPPSAPAAATGAADAAAGPAGAPLDLNTATAADLDALPGIGPVLAQRILDTRAQLGSFTSVEELGEVSGIGESRLADLRDLVAV